MVKSLLVSIALALLAVIPVKGQVSQNSLEFIRQFKSVEQDLVRERIYLHTDRDWYFHGDRIWFSAYVVAGPYNFASVLSEVLYVELYDPEGGFVERVSIQLVEGRGEGSITFDKAPDQAGRYRIKAYTAWALNFGDFYTFNKDLNVFIEELQLPSPEITEGLDVQFFPESGHLVDGIATRIGFKAVASDGYGAEVSGTIYSGNREVGKFQSIHRGMGFFEMTPGYGEEYYAEINGQRFQLPQVQEMGTVLHVEDEGDFFSVQIETNTPNVLETPLLFAHVRGEVFAAEVLNLEEGIGKTLIAKTQFPSGVVHFTVLNDVGLPVAERLSFNRNQVDKVMVNANLIEEQITARERTGIQLVLNDGQGSAIPGTASLSVFDDSIQPYNVFASTIKTQLFLESEVRGHVEHPGFYFSDDVNAEAYADLLLLTQGWKAYDMSSVLEDKLSRIEYGIEKGFRVSGKITGGLFGRSQSDAPVFFSMGENGAVSILTTDEEGEFLISDIPVQGSERFEIKANAESGSQNVSIRLNDQFGYLPANTEVISQLVSTPEKAQMHEQQPEIQEPVLQEAIAERAEAASADAELFIDVQMQGELEEITVTSDRIGVSEVGVQEDFATQIGRNVSGMGTHFDFDEQKELENYSIQDVLTRIPGVTLIRTPLGGLTFEINTNTISINADDPPPIIMLNGVQTEINTILSLIPEEIKSISVLRSAVDLAIFGAEGSGGALIVTTRDGTHSVESKGYLNGILLGYQLPATFYSPRYGVDVPTDLEKRDNRITLHWEPEFRVSARGVELPFWGNDVPGTYRLVLEGITETGTPFFYTDTFELTNQ